MYKLPIIAAVAALVAIAIILVPFPSSANHTVVDYLTVTDAVADDPTFAMTTAIPVPELIEGEHLITFWGWVVPSDADGYLKIAAITIHNNADDHQTFDSTQSVVQGFHPHVAKVDTTTMCLAVLNSPNWTFRVSENNLALLASGQTWTGTTMTGWIQPEDTDDNGEIDCFRVMTQQ